MYYVLSTSSHFPLLSPQTYTRPKNQLSRLFLFVPVCSELFHFVPDYSVLFRFIPFYSVLFPFVPFYSIFFRFNPFRSSLCQLTLSFRSLIAFLNCGQVSQALLINFAAMLGKLLGWNDTIAAIATAPGTGAIAVIRVSGIHSIDIVNQLFSKDLASVASHTIHHGVLVLDGELLDDVIVAVFRNPRSFTGEDVVEISCHGSTHVQDVIMKALAACGARVAKPGEFTQRAFLNGKMDLTQAEAVADLINSQSDASRKTALKHIRGGFSNELKELREQMIKFSALIELELDFSQEDVEFADRTALLKLLEYSRKTVNKLLNSFQLGNVIREGVQVAIIGRPNAGKSTLLNALLNEERAIVSEIAGTTRDTVEENLNINGVLFRLIDTAGIREHTSDLIEIKGIERSLEKMHSADVVLYIFDVNTFSTTELEKVVTEFEVKKLKYLLLANKTDEATEEKMASFKMFRQVIYVSAKEVKNIDELKQAIYGTTIGGSLNDKDVVVTNIRHVDALQKVQESLTDVSRALEENQPGDLLAIDIRRCLHYLGEITGEINNEEQLDFIFSKFCIGK